MALATVDQEANKVRLIDFEILPNNEFIAVNQFTVLENHNNKRPDIYHLHQWSTPGGD